MVLAHALSRAQRFAEAVEVLDRASSALDSGHAELALQLEAAAVLPALNDPVTAPSVALRRETLRERAASDPAAPPELLAAAAFVSILTNEPAEIGADLATRALSGRRQRSARLGQRAMVLVRSVVFAGHVRASLGRAVCAVAAAARCLDRAGAGDRRRRPARRRPARSRLACAPTRRSERRRRRCPDGACRDRAPRTTYVPRPERQSARQGARRSGRARRRRAGARAARSRSRERIRHGLGSSLRPRTSAGRTRTSRRRAGGLPGPWRRSDASDRHLPELPPLAIGGGARPARARRSRVGGTPRRRGARARPGIRRPACARRREACRRCRGRR